MAETRLTLIRHGETEWNREGRIQGYHADSVLTAEGRAQAGRVAERLAGERVDALFSSDAGRARQTAAPIAAAVGLDVLYDAGLRERNYGVFEGRTYEEIERESPEAYRKFRSRDPHYAPPEGESGAQFRDRVVAALERVAARSEARHAAVVTHGGVLGIAYRHVTDMLTRAAAGRSRPGGTSRTCRPEAATASTSPRTECLTRAARRVDTKPYG